MPTASSQPLQPLTGFTPCAFNDQCNRCSAKPSDTLVGGCHAHRCSRLVDGHRMESAEHLEQIEWSPEFIEEGRQLALLVLALTRLIGMGRIHFHRCSGSWKATRRESLR
jgi:hypothetical protein